MGFSPNTYEIKTKDMRTEIHDQHAQAGVDATNGALTQIYSFEGQRNYEGSVLSANGQSICGVHLPPKLAERNAKTAYSSRRKIIFSDKQERLRTPMVSRRNHHRNMQRAKFGSVPV
jgi:hypothetical protein